MAQQGEIILRAVIWQSKGYQSMNCKHCTAKGNGAQGSNKAQQGELVHRVAIRHRKEK